MYRLHRLPVILIQSIQEESGILRTYVSLLGIPVTIGIITFLLGLEIHKNFLELIIPSMVLFVGFSMNAVALMLRYAKNSSADQMLVNQVRNLAIYLVTLGVVSVVAAFIGVIAINNLGTVSTISPLPSAVYFILLSHFIMVVLLFPPRLFTVVENVDEKSESEEDTDGTRREHARDSFERLK